jgi:hypothetical protein
MGETKAQQALQGAYPQRMTSTYEGEECSSYGTADSEEEHVLNAKDNGLTDVVSDTLSNINCAIAAMGDAQHDIMQKLDIIEKGIRNMQGDMTWVREDLGVVHEVMEKIAEHVSGFEKNANEDDGPRDDVDLRGSPWGSWIDTCKEP